MKYAIFISYWNKDDVKSFDNFDEAQKEWEKIRTNKNALETDGGKNVVISDPRQGGVGRIYSTIHYQRSWDIENEEKPTRNVVRKMVKATEKQLNYISRLMGKTYEAEYDKLTVSSASALIDAIKIYKRPIFVGKRATDDSVLSFAYENLCRAEIRAFGHIFATR